MPEARGARRRDDEQSVRAALEGGERVVARLRVDEQERPSFIARPAVGGGRRKRARQALATRVDGAEERDDDGRDDNGRCRPACGVGDGDRRVATSIRRRKPNAAASLRTGLRKVLQPPQEREPDTLGERFRVDPGLDQITLAHELRPARRGLLTDLDEDGQPW